MALCPLTPCAFLPGNVERGWDNGSASKENASICTSAAMRPLRSGVTMSLSFSEPCKDLQMVCSESLIPFNGALRLCKTPLAMRLLLPTISEMINPYVLVVMGL